MSLVRFTVRNEYGLGRPELYGCDGDEDPQQILNGVAVAGLVGILRQLGDLSEFAAEIFHGLQEEVMTTASRSGRLMSRVRNIEDALPVLERQLLAQTSHIHLAYTSGHEWHPNIVNEGNHFINNDLPRCIMDSYEECNDPPSFHLLDKFDKGGSGSCLRRYSDPIFFTRASERRSGVNDKIERDKTNRKIKKKRVSQRHRDGPRLASMSNQSSRTRFSALSFNGRASSSQTASTADMASKSDLRRNSNCGSGLTESVSNANPSMKHEDDISSQSSASRSTQHADTDGSVRSDNRSEVVNDNFPLHPCQEDATIGTTCVTWDEKAEILESECQQFFGKDALEPDGGVKDISSFARMDLLYDDFYTAEPKSRKNQPDEMENKLEVTNQAEVERDPEIERQLGSQSEPDVDSRQETESEGEIFVDAPYSIELESESDRECNPKLVVDQNSSNTKKDRVDPKSCQKKQALEHNVILEDDEYIQEDGQATLAASDIQKVERISRGLSDDVTSDSNLGANVDVPSGSNGESGIISTFLSKPGFKIDLSNPWCINDKQCPHETQFEALHGIQSVKMWTNGGLLGLEPSKPMKFSKFSGAGDMAEVTENAPVNSIQETAIKDSCLHESSFEWLTSSPPLEHMKISFGPAEALKSPRIKLKFPHGLPSHESGTNEFPAFQLVPDREVSLNETFSDSDDDSFCRSSPYVSDDYPTENDSESHSEQWEEESGESPEKRDSECSYALREIPTPNSVSSSLTVDSKNRSMLAENGLQPSPSYPSLDSPSFDAWKPALQKEREHGSVPNSSTKLQNSTLPALPPLPPVQWWVSKTPSDGFEDKQQELRTELEHAFGQKISLSAVNKEPKVHQQLKRQADSNFNKKDTEMADFLHQIRTKQFNLRRTVTTKPSAETVPTTNVNIHAILQKANSIHQAVGDEDGDETDAWSE